VPLDEGIALEKRQRITMLVCPSLPQEYDFACARLFEAAHERRVMVEVVFQKAPRSFGRLNIARVFHLTPLLLFAS
jgi:hypothetical protein